LNKEEEEKKCFEITLKALRALREREREKERDIERE
jgi:hypothetical protein